MTRVLVRARTTVRGWATRTGLPLRKTTSSFLEGHRTFRKVPPSFSSGMECSAIDKCVSVAM